MRAALEAEIAKLRAAAAGAVADAPAAAARAPAAAGRSSAAGTAAEDPAGAAAAEVEGGAPPADAVAAPAADAGASADAALAAAAAASHGAAATAAQAAEAAEAAQRDAASTADLAQLHLRLQALEEERAALIGAVAAHSTLLAQVTRPPDRLADTASLHATPATSPQSVHTCRSTGFRNDVSILAKRVFCICSSARSWTRLTAGRNPLKRTMLRCKRRCRPQRLAPPPRPNRLRLWRRNLRRPRRG